MAGQYLLAQCRAGAWHADDKHRQFTGAAAAGCAREIVGIEGGNDPVGALHLCVWIVWTAFHFQFGATQLVALVHVMEGGIIVTLGSPASRESKVNLPALPAGHSPAPSVFGNARDLLLRYAGFQVL